MKIVVDSSIILEALKGKENTRLLLQYLSSKELYITPTVFDEVTYVVKKRKIKKLNEVIDFLLSYFDILPLDKEIVLISSSFMLNYNLNPSVRIS